MIIHKEGDPYCIVVYEDEGFVFVRNERTRYHIHLSLPTYHAIIKKGNLEFLKEWIRDVSKLKEKSIADIELALRLSQKRKQLEGED